MVRQLRNRPNFRAERIRRGVFHNVTELENAIHEWIEHRNQDPKPFTWTAKAKPILASHRRAQKALSAADGHEETTVISTG
jgi:hypothetical protein